jgi:hypothetical protein
VRDYREGSVSRPDVRRWNHVGDHRGSFDRLLVAWAFRISHIYRFIPYSAGRRHHSARYAFHDGEKRQGIKNGRAHRRRASELTVMTLRMSNRESFVTSQRGIR